MEPSVNSPGPSNAGFLGLQNNTGVLLITLSAALFIAIIVAGGLFIRAKEASDKVKRAQMREQLKKHES